MSFRNVCRCHCPLRYPHPEYLKGSWNRALLVEQEGLDREKWLTYLGRKPMPVGPKEQCRPGLERADEARPGERGAGGLRFLRRGPCSPLCCRRVPFSGQSPSQTRTGPIEPAWAGHPDVLFCERVMISKALSFHIH